VIHTTGRSELPRWHRTEFIAQFYATTLKTTNSPAIPLYNERFFDTSHRFP